MNREALSLKGYFHAELPRIEESLQQEIQALSPVVYPVATHILNAGGKRLRPMLCILTARALGYGHDSIYSLACALEMVHSASLLHDDILDNAVRRRGEQAAHLLFGVTETVLAGDALLALANKVVTGYGIVPLVACISEAIHQTAAGEVLEIERMRQPSLRQEEDLEIIIGKTGTLIQTCCESGAILAGCGEERQEAAKRFGLNLGIAFQMVDDALDYSSPEQRSGKPHGGDLREGKLTLPLIFFLQSLDAGSREEYLAKVKERTLTDGEHEWIVDQIERLRLGERTRREARTYLDRAREALDQFPPTPEKDLLGQLLEYIQIRKI
jgi:octaprenyl-diphosphate synthase